jgi:hypothetical protein
MPVTSSRLGCKVALFSEEVEWSQNESSNGRMNATAFLILGSVFGFNILQIRLHCQVHAELRQVSKLKSYLGRTTKNPSGSAAASRSPRSTAAF